MFEIGQPFYIPFVPFKYVTISTVISGLTLLVLQVALHDITPAETHNNIDSADTGKMARGREGI
jgi:hypothetical protein